MIGAWLHDLMLTIILFAGASALCWLCFLFWITNNVGNTPRTIILPTLNAGGTALLCAAPVFISVVIADPLRSVWPYALLLSLLLIAGHYWQVLRNAY